MVKKVKEHIAVNGFPSHNYGKSLAIWDHTVQRPGVELAIFRSLVRRPTTTLDRANPSAHAQWYCDERRNYPHARRPMNHQNKRCLLAGQRSESLNYGKWQKLELNEIQHSVQIMVTFLSKCVFFLTAASISPKTDD